MPILLLIAAITFAFDYGTKNLVEANMHMHESIPVIPGFFHITYIRNTGAAFSLLQNQTTLFIIITLAVIGLILYFAPRLAKESRLLQVALGLELGGAVGNLLDRIQLGAVTDFLEIRYSNVQVWPIFNVADTAVVIGGALLILYLLKGEREEDAAGKKEHKREGAEPDAGR